MATRKLTFADAVRLLGGEANAVGWLNRLGGVVAATVTVTTVGAVDLFAFRDEIVSWSNTAVDRIRERTRGLGRFDRTQRLVAAHSIIVVTSFYEALDEITTGIPELDLARVELTASEQVALATESPVARRYAEMVASLLETPPPMPAPHLPFEDALKVLEEHYRAVAIRLHGFLTGLSAFKQRSFEDQAQLMRQQLPSVAVARYSEAYRALAAEAPEFGVWSGMIEGQATRAALAGAAADLRSELNRLREAERVAVHSVRAGLSIRYRARLARSVLSSSDAPSHVTLPTLKQAYVKPHGLIAVAGPNDLPATEAWWRDKSSVFDVPDFLFGHLTGQEAFERPVVVLGQPGSGKSLLTEVLAAELPESDFLVVRVELRKIWADSSVQQQIERALYQLLGEALSWPDLVRRAGPALPVVIMDGFDELLQATGVNQADYLEQLREFQQREAELDRPVAVLVTSRTVVADRARFPRGTVVVRLEPFDDEQVAIWLDVWNTVNQPSLRQRGLRALPVSTVIQYGELARQPLLLLLLALYDAGANALQVVSGGIGRVDLYRRLFADFIAREVDKHDESRSLAQRELEIDAEWRRLSAVALAMLNRGGDVIREVDLETDIGYLLTTDDLRLARSDCMSGALTVGQLLVGRFFFIHESRASRATDAPERSFEFLHATFGEFLAARQIVSALTDLVEDRAGQRRRPGAVLDAGFLYVATSFITIARRAPLWEFCRGFIDRLEPALQRQCRQLVIELLSDAGFPHPTWSLAGYEPRRKPLAARHATYSANLVCFAVLLSDAPVEAADLVGEPALTRWRAQALLWQSQLDPEDRQRLWQMLRVAWDLTADPTVLRVRTEDGAPVLVYESLPWPPHNRPASTLPSATNDVRSPSESLVGRALRRSAFVQTAHEVREHLYALLPYWRIFGDTTVTIEQETLVSNAGALFELLLRPLRSRDEAFDRGHLYFAVLRHSGRDQRRLLFAQLVRDAVYLYVDDVLNILEILAPYEPEEAALAALVRELNRATRDAHSPDEITMALREHLEGRDLSSVLTVVLGVGSPPAIDEVTPMVDQVTPPALGP